MEVAHVYHERCITIMLPILDKPESEIGIDILLPSTVILRFFESISSTSRSNISIFNANSTQHIALLMTLSVIF